MQIAQNLNEIQGIGLPSFKWQNAPIGYILSYGVLPYVFGIVGIALLIYLVLGGFQLMFSRGDPKAAEGAKGKITNAIIGFVIVVFAYFLTQILGDMLGIGVFKDIFK